MEKIRNKHKSWIKDFLVVNLIEKQKLFKCNNPKEHILVQSIEIKELSLEVAFMLTNCYFVKITVKVTKEHIECKNDDSNNEKIFDIVVKVKIEP